MRNRISFVVCVLSVCGLSATPSSAQSTSGGRWEVEVHGGGAFENIASDGKGSLPPAGQTFSTAVGLPSRRASSWYFGDGATLMNQINGSFPGGIAPGRITPLDAVLQSAGAARPGGGSAGFRVSAAVTPRFGVEFTLDSALARMELEDSLLAGVETSRASFISAWDDRTGLIATGGGVVFIAPSVTSVTAIGEGKARQLFMTGAVTINLMTRGKIVPYATIGAGVVSNGGDTPSVTLTGNYRFQSLNALLPNYFPVSETDTVTIRLVPAKERPLVTVFGGGVKIHTSRRWGVRADARAYVSNNTVDTLVNASPQVAMSTTQPGLIFDNLIPSIQFSNTNILGYASNLTGPAITNFKTFSSSGTAIHVNVSGGLFVRF